MKDDVSTAEVGVQHAKFNLLTYFQLPIPGILGVSPVKKIRCGNKPTSDIHSFKLRPTCQRLAYYRQFCFYRPQKG